jgi:7-carboxy-7-deazaguanine synthase
MSYALKETFYSLQGEGAHAGRAAVFCRFAGCNLWSGREEDRAMSVCSFCDTDFVGTNGSGGGTFVSSTELSAAVESVWLENVEQDVKRFVVCTGGEPLVQLDDQLLAALHDRRFEVAVETNGTLVAPVGIDWTCVSPKAGTELLLESGDELKLVYPQAGAEPELYEHLDFGLFYIQPMDGPDFESNVLMARDYCLAHPRWRLGVQVHKLLGIR